MTYETWLHLYKTFKMQVTRFYLVAVNKHFKMHIHADSTDDNSKIIQFFSLDLAADYSKINQFYLSDTATNDSKA